MTTLCDKLEEIAAAEPDWPQYQRLALICVPAKSGEEAARQALVRTVLIKHLAAYSSVAEAKTLRAVTERYHALFRHAWASGQFDVIALDRVAAEERKLPRALAGDADSKIYFGRGEIHVGAGKSVRFGNVRVVESARGVEGAIKQHRGGRPSAVRNPFAGWIAANPGVHGLPAAKIAEIYKAEIPNAPGELDSLRRMVQKILLELAKTG